MRKVVCLLLAYTCLAQLSAQDYSVSHIPDSLKENANVICRYSELYYTVINEKKAKLYEKRVYTILNEAGQRFADYKTGYDQFTDINDLNGYLYNAAGKELKTVRKKDISDHAAYDGYSLMLDDRYKEHNFYFNDYPYTVMYEETDDIKQLFHMPEWDPQESELMSVEYSKLIVETPLGFNFRYKQFNLTAKPQIVQNKNSVTYTWEVKNLTTKKSEIWQPSWREVMPSVMLAPSSFGIDNYSGNMNTWQGYGLFMNELLKGRNVLPDDVKQKVHALTDNVKDPHEKVNVLYNYLQQNSRYISVQLGVGGWQPFDAKYVAANKYGDCKALSNYMIALLNEAGVKANYVIIKAGEDVEPIQADFPMSQFNHVTVCVPLNKDSVWLECTSQTKAPGFAGSFTGNRYALLIDETGGHIVATPRYTSKENKVVRNIKANLDSTGNLTAHVKTLYTGCETDDLHLQLEYLSKKDFNEKLKHQYEIATYDISNYAAEETKERVPSINENFELTAVNFSSVSGKRLFIKPNLLAYNSAKIDTLFQRKFDIKLTNAFTHIDSITIRIPTGYIIESLPKDVSLNMAYGNYSIQFKVTDNTIYCTRFFVQDAARFPAGDSKKFGAFINDIYKADRSKIVFIKN